LGDPYYVFVDVHHFHDRIAPRELVFNNSRVLRESRPIGRFRSEDRDFDGVRRRIAFNEGPGIAPIQRATGQHFQPRPVREVIQQTRVPETVRRDNDRNRNNTPNLTQQPARQGVVPEQQRIYREPQQVQPSPTGRPEQRIYREAPNPQTEPAQVPRAPNEVPRRAPRPEFESSRVAPTGQAPAASKAAEQHGKDEGQIRREEHTAPPAPAPAPAPDRRQREKDGE
jgi:hypothetical protein